MSGEKDEDSPSAQSTRLEYSTTTAVHGPCVVIMRLHHHIVHRALVMARREIEDGGKQLLWQVPAHAGGALRAAAYGCSAQEVARPG